MVEHLKPAVVVLLTLIASMLAQIVVAEELPDPTRPPAGFNQNENEIAAPVGPVLQSILISPSRRIAIISGKAVKAGDKYGDAQVIAINANDVVLRTGKSQQVLKLYPSLHNPVPISQSGGNLEVSRQSR